MSEELALIKKLREAVGAGMTDCKKALTEADGNFEEAITILRKKGIASAEKKTGRTTSEGLVGVRINGSTGVAIEINSETDFVARNTLFKNLISEVLDVAIDASSLNNLLAMSMKNLSVQDTVNELAGIIGEKLVPRRFAKINVKHGVVASYVHNSNHPDTGKVAVLIGIESESKEFNVLLDLGKKLCMQIAAMSPKYLNIGDVSSDILEHEKSIAREQLAASRKPENVIEKILLGKIEKYYEDNVLLRQVFVMDNKKTIHDVVVEYEKKLASSIKLVKMIAFKVGEEIK